MLSSIRRTVTAVFDRAAADASTGDAADASTSNSNAQSASVTDDGGRSLLHACPDCEEVYISEEPHSCSACDCQTVPVYGDDADSA